MITQEAAVDARLFAPPRFVDDLADAVVDDVVVVCSCCCCCCIIVEGSTLTLFTAPRFIRGIEVDDDDRGGDATVNVDDTFASIVF